MVRYCPNVLDCSYVHLEVVLKPTAKDSIVISGGDGISLVALMAAKVMRVDLVGYVNKYRRYIKFRACEVVEHAPSDQVALYNLRD